MKKRIRLGTLTVAILFIIMTLLVVASSVISHAFFQDSMGESLLSNIDSVVDSNARSLSDLVTRIQSCMDLFPDNRSSTLNELLFTGSDNYQNNVVYLRLKAKLEHYLSTMLGGVIAHPTILFIADDSMPMSRFLCKAYPENVFTSATYMAPQTLLSQAANFREEDFYLRARSLNGGIHWFTREGDSTTLYAAREMRQRQIDRAHWNDYTMGVMLIGFDVEWIRAQLSASPIMRDARVFVASGDIILYDSGSEYIGRRLEGAVAPIDSDQSGRDLCMLDQTSCYHWSAALSSGLFLHAIIPQRDIRDLISGSVRLVQTQLLFVSLATMAVIILLVRQLIKPIEWLSNHMRSQNMTPIQAPFPAAHVEEVNALYDSFNIRTRQVNELMDEIRAIEREKHRKDLQLLQAQINPHFVYNTLDSISCMALMDKKDEIAEAMAGLASILRYNTKDPSALVPFSEELRMIRTYLSIQALRSTEKPQALFDVDERGLDWLMPKMSVQPLVENAIVHTTGQPCLSISSRVEGDVMTICVANHNDHEDVDKIMRHLTGDIDIVTRSTGLGIRSVDQRIRMVFGDEFGLRYTREGEWLKAILTLSGKPLSSSSKG